MSKKLANISVVMPARNEEARIADALVALLEQTILPKQLIVVNNGSSDRTAKVLDSFRPQFAAQGIDFQILNEEVVGLAPARNKGFFAATQPLIASTDADCRVHSDWLEKIESHFQEFDSVAVTGIPIMDDSSYLVEFITEHNYFLFLTEIIKMVFGFQTITTATAAIKRAAFLEVGGFDDSARTHYDLDDSEISSRLSLIGKVRIDTRIRTNASFRRHSRLLPAIKVNFERVKSLRRISKRYKLAIKQRKRAD